MKNQRPLWGYDYFAWWSKYFGFVANTKMQAPHAVDMFHYVWHVPNHLTTFFSSSSQVVHWSAEIQTKVYDPRIDQPIVRPSEWIRAHSLNSYFAFCKIVVKCTQQAQMAIKANCLCTHSWQAKHASPEKLVTRSHDGQHFIPYWILFPGR